MSEITRDIKSYDTNEQKHFLMELRKLGIDIPTYSVYEIKETPETFEISINEETPTIEFKKKLIEIIKKKEVSELDKQKEKEEEIKFEMKIIKNEGIVTFETSFGNEEISKLTINSNDKKGIKRYLKKFLK